MYRALDFNKIVSTLTNLQVRIYERFPEAGLYQVSKELESLLAETESNLKHINQPNVALRAGVATLLLIICVTIPISLVKFDFTWSTLGLMDVITLFEAFANDVVLLSVAIFFLVTLETRVKRSRALEALNQLRAVAHIIDMHQLTKDPIITLNEHVNTPSSPVRKMSAFELARYLDYCSEMLSIVGKVSALYAQEIPDSEVVAAVKDVEDLTLDLCEKIWQKIVLINREL